MSDPKIQGPTRDLMYTEDGDDYIILDENMHRTLDGKIVDEQNLAGRFLYGIKGQRVSRKEAELLGICKAKAKAPVKPAAKKTEK